MKRAYKNGIILDGSKDMKPISGKIILTNGKCYFTLVRKV